MRYQSYPVPPQQKGKLNTAYSCALEAGNPAFLVHGQPASVADPVRTGTNNPPRLITGRDFSFQGARQLIDTSNSLW